MAGFFDKISSGVGNLEKKFLGPTYNYAKQIKTPNEIGITSKGTMDALGADVQGLIAFTEILVSGLPIPTLTLEYSLPINLSIEAIPL